MSDADLREEIMRVVDQSGASGDEIRDVAARLKQVADLKDKQEEVMLRD